MKNILIALIALMISSCVSPYVNNLEPMYGSSPGNYKHNKNDKNFIRMVTEDKGIDSAIVTHRRWAFYYTINDKPDMGMKRFNQVWLLDSSLADSYYGFSFLMKLKNRMIESEKYLIMAKERDLDGKADSLFSKFERQYKEMHRSDRESIEFYKSQLGEDELQNSLMIAYHYSNLDMTDSSIYYNTKALKLDPNNVHGLINRANSYLELKKYKLAIADYTKCIEVDSENIKAKAQRALAYYNLGEKEKALEEIKKFIDLDPRYKQGLKMSDEYKDIINDPLFKELFN